MLDFIPTHICDNSLTRAALKSSENTTLARLQGSKIFPRTKVESVEVHACLYGLQYHCSWKIRIAGGPVITGSLVGCPAYSSKHDSQRAIEDSLTHYAVASILAAYPALKKCPKNRWSVELQSEIDAIGDNEDYRGGY